MRALLQRVTYASVTVEGRPVGQIGRGFLILLGVTHADSHAEAAWLANKIAGLRVFEDDAGKLNRSLDEIGGEILVVSQFTLYGDTRKGRRPSFDKAARPEQSEPLYDYFVGLLQEAGFRVATGVFGAYMQIDLQNDGPVTLLLEREN